MSNENTMDNRKIIVQSVRNILTAIGENPDREGLQETPLRVAKMYEEIYSSVTLTNEELVEKFAKTFTEAETDDAEKFGDMVIVTDIPFYSTCEHHLVPFFGYAHVAYIPSDKIIGLSKIARLVEAIARRPQVQERITKDVADCLEKMLNPIGVYVVIKAEHLCMAMRGVKKPGAKTVTSAARGAFKDDSATRMEFLSLIKE
jgi:GTP cyclohydrolase I